MDKINYYVDKIEKQYVDRIWGDSSRNNRKENDSTVYITDQEVLEYRELIKSGFYMWTPKVFKHLIQLYRMRKRSNN